MAIFYTLREPFGIYVKTEAFFKEQRGETEPWGKKWRKTEATSIEDARLKAPLAVYIATGLANWERHNEVRNALATAGHSLTYDWTVHGPVRGQGYARIREVAGLEMNGVARADALIALLPAGLKSSGRGTHAEIGMALALGKPILLWSDDPEIFSQSSEKTCAFYHHALITPLTCPMDQAPGLIVAFVSVLMERQTRCR